MNCVTNVPKNTNFTSARVFYVNREINKVLCYENVGFHSLRCCRKVIFIVQINHRIIEDIMISKTFLVCTLVYIVLNDRNVWDFHG